MTREERREYKKKRRAEHREKYNARCKKWRSEHREQCNATVRKYRAEHREEHRTRFKKYQAEDLNKYGVTKNYIRTRSRIILGKCHAKLPGYQIHHCFGYDDPGKFIYIPRELHQKIHQYLRDNHIQADIDHFNAIRELISAYTGYTYIRT